MNFSTQHFSFPQKWLWLLFFFPFLIAFMFAQTASAGIYRPQMIFTQATPQQVDTNGDGRLETFSADYTVYDDGTADGEIYLDSNLNVVVESGSIEVGPDNEIIVTAIGEDSLGEIHTLTYQFEPREGENGGYGILLFDTTSSMPTHAFEVSVQLFIR